MKRYLPCLSLALLGCATSAPVDERADYTETIRGTDITFDMVWIPDGNLWVGKTEVTWDEYLTYCDFGERESTPPGVDVVTRPSKPLETFAYDHDWGKGRRPAIGMSWSAAQKYCQWLSLNTGTQYRLPTEAEWRVACGAMPDALDDHAWHRGNSDGKTREVGQKLPNEFGLFDTLGNVWEYTSEPFDPATPEWAALRGGSWADQPDQIGPDARIQFDEFWILLDPNVPPGVWWVPDGATVGLRIIRTPSATDR